MRLRLFLVVFYLFLLAVSTAAQSPRRIDTSGGPTTISRPNPMTTPAVRDPNLEHIGAVEFWDKLAPNKNLAPSVTRIVGKDLHLALFNYTPTGGKRQSTVAFQLKPFVAEQVIEVQIFAIEQNGQRVIPQRMIAPQQIALKKTGAVLPFTVELKDGESLVCEIYFLANGTERGKAKLLVNSRGLDFVPEKRDPKLVK
ncbi:MAG: hypothetical protein HY231_17310 [Acidobacteria bacterium]|nr:hypothetical protein [Acidobacteriota bacterium]